MSYQPKTGAACACRPGRERDNCPTCEGTGQCIDFQAIRLAAAGMHDDAAMFYPPGRDGIEVTCSPCATSAASTRWSVWRGGRFVSDHADKVDAVRVARELVGGAA